jgi:DNA-binding transcriptional ArsR family regulator
VYVGDTLLKGYFPCFKEIWLRVKSQRSFLSSFYDFVIIWYWFATNLYRNFTINKRAMAHAKTEEFTEKQNKTATMLKAMGHPARVAIVEYLIKQDSCVCGDIVDHLPLAQATVSQHLKALKEAGVITGTVEGTSVCYCIDEKALQFLMGYFQTITEQLKQQQRNCC